MSAHEGNGKPTLLVHANNRRVRPLVRKERRDGPHGQAGGHDEHKATVPAPAAPDFGNRGARKGIFGPSSKAFRHPHVGAKGVGQAVGQARGWPRQGDDHQRLLGRWLRVSRGGRKGSPLPRGPEAVGVGRVVQMAAGFLVGLRRQRRTHQDQRVAGPPRLPHLRRDVGQRPAEDALVRPGSLVHDGHRRVGRVGPSGQQCFHHVAHPVHAQVDGQGRAVGREVLKGFAGWHRRTAGRAGEDHRLGHAGHGEFHAQPGRGRKGRRHAGDDLVRDPGRLQAHDLLVHRAVDGRVAAVQPRDHATGPHGVHHERDDFLQGEGCGPDDARAAGPRGRDQAFVNQTVGVDDEVRAQEDRPPAQGDEVRRARTGADEVDFGGDERLEIRRLGIRVVWHHHGLFPLVARESGSARSNRRASGGGCAGRGRCVRPGGRPARRRPRGREDPGAPGCP